MLSKNLHLSQNQLVSGSFMDVKGNASACEPNCNTNETTSIVNSSPASKKKIIKNLGIVSLSFLLSFTAFSGTVNLQSSLNSEGDLGNQALTALNLGAIISNLFLSTVMLNKLGLKWSLIISLAMHLTFPAANFYPKWFTLFPGAVITGLGGGPLWSAKSAYLTMLGEKYAEIASETAEAAISRFFGIFFMIYRGSTLTGNVISSLIFKRPSTSNAQLLPQNIIKDICGHRYCYQDLNAIYKQVINQISFNNASFITSSFPSTSVTEYTSWAMDTSAVSFDYENSTLDNITFGNETIATESNDGFYKPTLFQVYLLFGIYLACGIAACPLIAFINPMKSTTSDKVEEKQSVLSVILATFKHMKNPKEMMLIPLAFFSGVSYAFITADFCVGFVTCVVGIDNVGYVMTAFGASAGLGAVIFGPLLKYTGRQSIFIFGGICNFATLIAMLYWPPAAEKAIILYVLAAFWGLSNAIWTSQFVAFIGFVFKNGNTEAAFACNYLWQMIGNCLWHACSVYLCLNLQIFVMGGILGLGLLGYLGVEILLYRENKPIIED
ncbi:Protein unc-93 A [Chamberlinius hualienensis]